LPLDIVWSKTLHPALAHSFIEAMGLTLQSAVSRSELLGIIIAATLNHDHYPLAASIEAWLFCRNIPADRLEFPTAGLLGWPGEPHWRFMVCESLSANWFGAEPPPIRQPLAESWQQTKTVWERASSELALQRSHQNEVSPEDRVPSKGEDNDK
jgi:hypothetical protein